MTHGPHVLRMTCLPPGPGPYDRWELTVEDTGELLDTGPMPFDREAVGATCEAYHARVRRREGRAP